MVSTTNGKQLSEKQIAWMRRDLFQREGILNLIVEEFSLLKNQAVRLLDRLSQDDREFECFGYEQWKGFIEKAKSLPNTEEIEVEVKESKSAIVKPSKKLQMFRLSVEDTELLRSCLVTVDAEMGGYATTPEARAILAQTLFQAALMRK
ncbi:hypothetical protein [Gloeobacter morelensis]|uniref:hypothetical protein n=1 Tax=Gloeobacter morelensis TaxID=2907343 RepID=UPI001E5E258F|nr:hypothetical protein [Gloeobacter morelensis]UFP97237.1 hypothetical protein ISF26_24250 [Gloeobacter morelensis MG652769]